MNNVDDCGVLEGRWDGNYSDGVSPIRWTGSVAILQKYMSTMCPVSIMFGLNQLYCLIVKLIFFYSKECIG